MLAGVVVFRKNHPAKGKFALFGLWNFLALPGMTIAAHCFKIDNEFTQKKDSPHLRGNFWRAIRPALIIAGTLYMLYLILNFNELSHGSLAITFLFPLALILIIILSGTSVIYVITNNKYLRNFIFLFTAFFIILTVLVQNGLYYILGLL
jgi:hypothetical protein